MGIDITNGADDGNVTFTVLLFLIRAKTLINTGFIDLTYA